MERDKSEQTRPNGNTSIFCGLYDIIREATVKQARIIKQCLDSFCKLSGQKVNYQKSLLTFSKNTDEGLQQAIASELGIPKTDNVGRYLGVPSFQGKIRKESFDDLFSSQVFNADCQDGR